MAVEVTKATPRDIADLYHRLRQADYDEVRAASGPGVADTIMRGFEITDDCWAGRSPDGTMLAVWGVAPSPAGGVIWLLGTYDLDHYKGAHLRLSVAYVAEKLAQYGRLYNYVDARNTTAIRWLKRLGFTVHPPEPQGYAGLPFHLFEKLHV